MLTIAAAIMANLPIITAASAADAAKAPVIGPVCQDVGPHLTDKSEYGASVRRRTAPDGPAAHPLTQEPPADAIATVIYTEGQCSKPVVISKGIGATPPQK